LVWLLLSFCTICVYGSEYLPIFLPSVTLSHLIITSHYSSNNLISISCLNNTHQRYITISVSRKGSDKWEINYIMNLLNGVSIIMSYNGAFVLTQIALVRLKILCKLLVTKKKNLFSKCFYNTQWNISLPASQHPSPKIFDSLNSSYLNLYNIYLVVIK
jgi:hypothetical protein